MEKSSAIAKTMAIGIAAIIIIAAIAVGTYLVLYNPFSGGQANVPQYIKIGLLTHRSGASLATGQDIERGFTLAVDEINAKGGVYVSQYGKNLTLQPYIEDQQSSQQGTIDAANKLINQDKVDIIVGGFGSAFIYAAQPTIAQAGVPYIITGVSTPRVVTRTDIDTSWFVLYQATGIEQGGVISKILADAVKPAAAKNRHLKIAVLYQDSPFGQDYFAGLNGTIVQNNLPIDIVYVNKFKVGTTDFHDLLTGAKAANPDVIVPIGFIGETIPAIQQGQDIIPNKIWGPVCTCVDDASYYKNIGKKGAYTLMETYFGPYSAHPSVKDKVATFVEKFKNKFGVPPGSQALAVYDAVYIAAKAIQLAGTLDKTKIRDELRNMTIPQLLTPVPGGQIHFGSKGQQTFDIYGVQLIWNATLGEPRPVIIWPLNIPHVDFQLPPGFSSS